MKTLADCLVLIVDDTETNVDILVEALSEDYGVAVAMDGPTALEFAAAQHPDLVLLDIMMPGMDGYEVCRRLKADPATAAIPLIFLTAMTEVEHKARGFELGAADYVTKPFEVREIKARVHTHLSLVLARLEHARQEELLEAKTRELARLQEAALEALAALTEYRDPTAPGRIRRIRDFVRLLARHLQLRPGLGAILPDASMETLSACASLQDLGPVRIRDDLLLNPGQLPGEAYEELKRQAASRREHWDGSGQPLGLAGDAIPVAGRILAIVDAYDALVHPRDAASLTHVEAVQTIAAGRGTLYDPVLVDAFVAAQDSFQDIV